MRRIHVAHGPGIIHVEQRHPTWVRRDDGARTGVTGEATERSAMPA
jgi:hypothetical protein